MQAKVATGTMLEGIIQEYYDRFVESLKYYQIKVTTYLCRYKFDGLTVASTGMLSKYMEKKKKAANNRNNQSDNKNDQSDD